LKKACDDMQHISLICQKKVFLFIIEIVQFDHIYMLTHVATWKRDYTISLMKKEESIKRIYIQVLEGLLVFFIFTSITLFFFDKESFNLIFLVMFFLGIQSF
ncbi:hypothetical protein ACJX0J_013677, partial [Zea mays]